MSEEALQLAKIRQNIDDLDAQLLQLFNQRAKYAQEVAKIKEANANGEEVIYYRPERERQVLQRIADLNQGPLASEFLQKMFRELMSACLALEKPLKIAYLGPEGTFSETAVYKQFGNSAQAEMQANIQDIFTAVENKRCDYGIVPVENSTEGAINHTLDCLMNSNLQICGELKLRIKQNLLAKSASTTIEKVYGHAQSLAQCRNWLSKNMPQAQMIAVSSNAEGARLASKEALSACIASERAADLYNLQIMHENIEDESNNTTRFLVLGLQYCAPSETDKTSLLLNLPNESGSLFQVLEPIKRLGLNMTKIESRPSRRALWDYNFFIDLDGHQEEETMQALFAEFKRQALPFRILGSYPKAL